MAIILCPECGQQISDKAKKCIYCGKLLMTEETQSKNFCYECGKEISVETEECPFCGCPLEVDDLSVIPKPKKAIKGKKLIIVATVILILTFITYSYFNYINLSLNEDEQFAYQNALKMQSMMKNPDSFKLYDEMVLLKKFSEDGSLRCTYTIFKYGGTNIYGALLTDEAIFKDHQYLMNYTDEPDKDSSDYVDQLQAKLDITKYLLEGDSDRLKMVEIDIEKVKKKMELQS